MRLFADVYHFFGIGGHTVNLVFPKRRLEVNVTISFVIVNAENTVTTLILTYSTFG